MGGGRSHRDPCMRPTPALLSRAAAPGAAPAARAELQARSGPHAGPHAGPRHGGSSSRGLVLHDGRREIIVTHALDPGLTQRTSGGASHGGRLSDAVARAHRTVLDGDRKPVTLPAHDPRIGAAMGTEGCHLTANIQTDEPVTGRGSRPAGGTTTSWPSVPTGSTSASAPPTTARPRRS